jgi:hypothetical protein
MGMLVEIALLSLPFLGTCLSLVIHHRAKMHELLAVIRAQRRCMDCLGTELSSWDRLAKKTPLNQDQISSPIGSVDPAARDGLILGVSRGYSIVPSLN